MHMAIAASAMSITYAPIPASTCMGFKTMQA